MKRQVTIKLLASAIIGTTIVLVACSRQPSTPLPGQALTLAALNDQSKTPNEMAHYIYANYNCNSCHTLSDRGQFGFTAKGQQLRQSEEGCVGLLTSMSVIAHVSDSDRNPTQKAKAAHFKEFGCTVCHQVEPGRISLTPTGEKLASLHMSCPEVEKLLTQKGQDRKAQAGY